MGIPGRVHRSAQIIGGIIVIASSCIVIVEKGRLDDKLDVGKENGGAEETERIKS